MCYLAPGMEPFAMHPVNSLMAWDGPELISPQVSVTDDCSCVVDDWHIGTVWFRPQQALSNTFKFFFHVLIITLYSVFAGINFSVWLYFMYSFWGVFNWDYIWTGWYKDSLSCTKRNISGDDLSINGLNCHLLTYSVPLSLETTQSALQCMRQSPILINTCFIPIQVLAPYWNNLIYIKNVYRYSI